MNERIRELADQCYHRYSEHHIDLEKFAELIVKECIGCCDEVGRINQYHIKKDFIDPELGPKECIEVIKKHFGVEE